LPGAGVCACALMPIEKHINTPSARSAANRLMPKPLNIRLSF